MANFLQMLAEMLSGQGGVAPVAAGPVNRLTNLGGMDTPAGGGALDAVGQRIMQQQLNPYMGGAAPVNAQPAPSAAPVVDNVQTASTPSPAPSGGGIGGFVQGLFGGGNEKGYNETVQWLQRKGYDAGAAQMIAKDKPTLQKVLLTYGSPQEVDEYTKRATAALRLGLKQGSPEFTNFVAGRDIIKGQDEKALVNAGDGRLYDPNTKQWITAPNDAAGGGFRFSGNSVEAQALNGLIQSGQLTEEEAMQVAAGKVITNPADGSQIFMTPQGLFGRDATGNVTPVAPAATAQPAPAPIPAAPASPAITAPVAPAPSTDPAVPTTVAPSQPTAPSLPNGAKPIPGAKQLTPGKPGKMATEAETRARALYTVASPEMKIVEDMFPALGDNTNQALDKMPWNSGNWLTSEDYQRGKNSLMTIIQSYMYVTSGASAPDAEVERNANSLMPKMGDKPQTIKDKLARINNYVRAIKQAGGETPSTPGEVEDGNDPLDVRKFLGVRQ